MNTDQGAKEIVETFKTNLIIPIVNTLNILEVLLLKYLLKVVLLHQCCSSKMNQAVEIGDTYQEALIKVAKEEVILAEEQA